MDLGAVGVRASSFARSGVNCCGSLGIFKFQSLLSELDRIISYVTFCLAGLSAR